MGQELQQVRIASPFLLRSLDPPLVEASGRRVQQLRRIGKRIAISLEADLWLVLHLMIAGRLQWAKPNAKLPGRRGLAAFDFDSGTLLLTEARAKRRASLHLARGEDSLQAFDPGGLEPLSASHLDFSQRVLSSNHTLKRALTDPRLFSGIGNAYSDEILHAARLSPLALTQKLDAAEIERLWHATSGTLRAWIERLRAKSAGQFPGKVTAFHPEMAVHGRYGLPCPVCQTKVRRIRYAENETNYCPQCQTEGRLLADRSLSRLLQSDWPRTVEDWELTQSRRRTEAISTTARSAHSQSE